MTIVIGQSVGTLVAVEKLEPLRKFVHGAGRLATSTIRKTSKNYKRVKLIKFKDKLKDIEVSIGESVKFSGTPRSNALNLYTLRDISNFLKKNDTPYSLAYPLEEVT